MLHQYDKSPSPLSTEKKVLDPQLFQPDSLFELRSLNIVLPFIILKLNCPIFKKEIYASRLYTSFLCFCNYEGTSPNHTLLLLSFFIHTRLIERFRQAQGCLEKQPQFGLCKIMVYNNHMPFRDNGPQAITPFTQPPADPTWHGVRYVVTYNWT